MSEIKGDLQVCRTVTAARRVNQGLIVKTITGTEQLAIHSHYWQKLDAASGQDVVLPDATTLPLGWEITVQAVTSTLSVKTYDPVTPVLREEVEPGRAYKFTLIDNGTDEGTWYVDFLEESDKIASTRYVETFNATTDWGAASGGYYTKTIAVGTHGRGVSPQVEVQELSGADYVTVLVDELKTLANGDVTIRVTESPDCRFEGRAILV